MSTTRHSITLREQCHVNRNQEAPKEELTCHGGKGLLSHHQCRDRHHHEAKPGSASGDNLHKKVDTMKLHHMPLNRRIGPAEETQGPSNKKEDWEAMYEEMMEHTESLEEKMMI